MKFMSIFDILSIERISTYLVKRENSRIQKELSGKKDSF